MDADCEIDKLKTKAIEFANTLLKQSSECPSEALNPGLYYGFIAGYMSRASEQANPSSHQSSHSSILADSPLPKV
jgi:hypothetical protein